ncbi:MAG: hypothetical protein IPL62_03185 [Caulobacteraceae bacterium]|nr:hypothetical protein [Caulobacteraceae bacterium]
MKTPPLTGRRFLTGPPARRIIPPGPSADASGILSYSARRALFTREFSDALVEQRKSALTALLHQRPAFGGDFDAEATLVLTIRAFGEEAIGFEIADELGHRGGRDLLGAGETFQTLRAAKGEHGEGRELGRRHAGFIVCDAGGAQQPDGSPVERGGDFEGICAGHCWRESRLT